VRKFQVGPAPPVVSHFISATSPEWVPRRQARWRTALRDHIPRSPNAAAVA